MTDETRRDATLTDEPPTDEVTTDVDAVIVSG